MESLGVLAGHILGLARSEELREDGAMHVVNGLGGIRGELIDVRSGCLCPSRSFRAGPLLFSPQLEPPIWRRPATGRRVLEIIRQECRGPTFEEAKPEPFARRQRDIDSFSHQ